MNYFDAVASGRFKRVGDQWTFYPWGERGGYVLPAREDYWRIHAWTARIIKVWFLLTVVLWGLVGPIAVPLVAVPGLAWYRRRLPAVVATLPTTDVRLRLAESYRSRAEAHNWTSLWLTAGGSFVGILAAAAASVQRPDLLVSGVVAAAWFATLLGGATFMIRSKGQASRVVDSVRTEPNVL